MRTSDFEYELPSDYIAQVPIEPRDAARLLVLEQRSGIINHAVFRDLSEYLKEGDLLVLNKTRVIPARLFGKKIPSGGRIELLLLCRGDKNTWEVLVGGKGLITGRKIQVEFGPEAEIVAELEGARRLVRFSKPVEAFLSSAGHVPLPPYIKAPLDDFERYQTVYAHQPGSAAAPTAGLHFTAELIDQLKDRGLGSTSVTLHIGLDTFAPVNEEDASKHLIHTEWCQVTDQAAAAVNQCRQNGGRIVAVGTTSVRALESAARVAAPGEVVGSFQGPTDLFILPGFEFRVVDAMITNFHLPRSTLLMLVSAFAGREVILDTYEVAKKEHYRFYSFGDAMLIL